MKKTKIKLPTFLESVIGGPSEIARLAHKQGNAAGTHQKNVNRQNRRRNKQEARDVERGNYENDLSLFFVSLIIPLLILFSFVCEPKFFLVL